MELDLVLPLIALFFLNQLLEWIQYGWWIWLFILGWWWYSWAKDHLPFSPLFALVVGAILVYFLVIEHPLIGSAGMIFWVILSSGIIWMLPYVLPFMTFWKMRR